MAVLQRMPEDAHYRKETESLTQKRLQLVEQVITESSLAIRKQSRISTALSNELISFVFHNHEKQCFTLQESDVSKLESMINDGQIEEVILQVSAQTFFKILACKIRHLGRVLLNQFSFL